MKRNLDQGDQVLDFEKAIEWITKEKVETLRSKTITEVREMVEAKHGGKKMRFYSEWPFIGRGNIHSDVVSREEIDAELDAALR